jgi:D-lactate dehydrogenase (cytochrome)
MRDNVLGLEAVLGTGEVVRFGGRARKSSAGYDLVRLLVGSEGTLGVITKLTLRLQPIPEAHRTALVQGADGATLIAFAVGLLQAGVVPSKVEYMDAAAIRAVRLRDPALDLAEAPALLVELAGAPEAVEGDAARAIDLAAGFELPPMRWARTAEARAAVWRARHGVAHAETLLRPGARSFVTDVAVPVSRLASCIADTRLDIDRSGFVASIVAHVGDGNFHVSLLIDPAEPEEVERAEVLHCRLVERALAMGGTCSGEHGIGIGKHAHLVSEVGLVGIGLMRGIKRLFDPAGIMNPGKIFEAVSPR